MRDRRPTKLTTFLCVFIAGCGGTALISVEQEQAIGDEMSKQVEEQIGLYAPGELSDYVDAVGERLVTALGDTRYTFNFDIVDQGAPNAFASPGGYIYISRGLLSLINSEDELAGIIAHEISHVTARHHARQASKGIVPGLLSLPGRAVGAVVSEDLGNIINAPITTAGKVYLSSYSRGQETDADRKGMALAARAGYDPNALGSALDKLGKTVELFTGGAEQFSFYDTHPTTPTRLADIERIASTILWDSSAPLFDQAGLYGHMDGLWWGPQNPTNGIFIENTFLQADLDITITLPDDWKHMNTPRFVGAVEPGERAFIALSGAGPKIEPILPANALIEEMRDSGGIEPAENRAASIGEWPAHLVRYEDTSGKEPVSVYYLFVTSPERSFLLIGLSAAEHREQLRETALSFRKLSADEQASIQGYRLRIASAEAGDSLVSLGDRTDNVVRTDLIAVMNGLPNDAILNDGQLVKIVRKEVYSPD